MGRKGLHGTGTVLTKHTDEKDMGGKGMTRFNNQEHIMLSLKVRPSKKLALILQNIVGIAKNMGSFFLFHRENISWHICGNDVFYSMKFSKYTQGNPEDIKMNIKRS